MKKFLLTASALALLLAPGAQAAEGFTPAQKAEIEVMIRQFLTEKEPETIMKAVEVLRQREAKQQQEVSKEAVAKNRDKLFNDPNSPILGNPKGDVTIIEFYDYQCGYCKMAQAGLKALLEQDKNVRFIAKEFPILGEGSTLATRAALAAIKQNKFEAMHNGLMEFRGQLNDGSITEIATRMGLDVNKLKKDMNDKSVDDMIAENRKLGNDVGVRGTPMFIIGDAVHPGALDAEALKQAVANARAANKK